MQGACDPTKEEGCTDENNNIDTGGAITPTPTSKQIVRKAADLNFILKSTYEQFQYVRDVG
eukprot:6433346-Ditylum_brightwellii.AAC.1